VVGGRAGWGSPPYYRTISGKARPIFERSRSTPGECAAGCLPAPSSSGCPACLYLRRLQVHLPRELRGVNGFCQGALCGVRCKTLLGASSTANASEQLGKLVRLAFSSRFL